MKYFLVEGIIKDASKMSDCIMEEHQTYTKEKMDTGVILLSGLKADMSGAMFIIEASSLLEVNDYLDNEPFYIHGIQEYKIKEFTYHYFNSNWHK